MRQPDNAKSPMSVYFLSLFRSIMLYVLQMGLQDRSSSGIQLQSVMSLIEF